MGKELTEEAKIARREYKRKWYAEHPGKQREYQQRYWVRKAAEQAEQQKARETDAEQDH